MDRAIFTTSTTLMKNVLPRKYVWMLSISVFCCHGRLVYSLSQFLNIYSMFVCSQDIMCDKFLLMLPAGKTRCKFNVSDYQFSVDNICSSMVAHCNAPLMIVCQIRIFQYRREVATKKYISCETEYKIKYATFE